MEFENQDPDYEKRIDRHIDFHKTHSVTKRSYNGQEYSKNINVVNGTPTFTEIK